MSRSYLSLCVAIAGLSACATVVDTPQSTSPLPDALERPVDFELVWSEEFSVDGLPDEANWKYDKWRNKEGWWNQEKQYYAGPREKNARVENGHLIIEVHNEPTPVEQFPDTGGQDYTSARLITADRAAWQYGYFEIRAKLPCGRGLWPAIWTLPQDRIKWPLDGEIDIAQDGAFRLVMKIDVLETHAADLEYQRRRSRRIDDLRLALEQLEHKVHVRQSVLDLAVDDPQKVQRYKKLQQQCVDQYEVADAHRPGHHPPGGEEHDEGHT